MPSGFITVTPVRSANAPVIGPGVSANAISVTIGAPIETQSTGRQRREGSRPSGNNRNNGMKLHRTTTISQRSTQAAAVPNGSDPGSTFSACVA
jgi:hypothetical protein